MGQHYRQLTAGERNQLYALRKAKIPMTDIAALIGRPRQTLYSELKRNTGGRGYRPVQAQQFALFRRSGKASAIKMLPHVIGYIEEKLHLQWSPEQISGIMESGPNGPGIRISHERIYQHVWADKRAGGTLYTELRHGLKKRRKRRGTKDSRGKIRNRVDIDERPTVVEERNRLGDWEADLVCGSDGSGYLVTLFERVSRRVRIGFTRTKTAAEVTVEILRLLKDETVETITFDNGKEFAGHEKIAAAIDGTCYFAKPYHSWERGGNENANGLIRQYFPKKTSLEGIMMANIAFVENRLNTRPRKCLGFNTPDRIYYRLVA